MPDFSIFNADQRKVLRFLYENPGQYTHSKIEEQCGPIDSLDLEALCYDHYYRVVRRTERSNHEYLHEISPRGRGIYEAIQKQEEDEAYQRDLDHRSLEMAKQANKKAGYSNVIAIIAGILSLAAIAVTIWAELRA